MNVKKTLRKYYAKYGNKALVIFAIYFVTKWTLTFIFGAKLLAIVKDLFH